SDSLPTRDGLGLLPRWARVGAGTWQAFWLTAVDGRPPRAVAAELGLSVGAVYQARYRVGALLAPAHPPPRRGGARAGSRGAPAVGAACPPDGALGRCPRGGWGAAGARAMAARAGGSPACERRLGQLAGGPPWPLGLAAGWPQGGADAEAPTTVGDGTQDQAP